MKWNTTGDVPGATRGPEAGLTKQFLWLVTVIMDQQVRDMRPELFLLDAPASGTIQALGFL